MRNLVKVERARKDMTQEELANALGVTRHTIIQTEKQTYDLPTSVALKMARYFNMKMEDLFTLEEDD